MAKPRSNPKTFERYGIFWPISSDPIEIEFRCIREGGRWQHQGKDYGAGLDHHYKMLDRLLWPDDVWDEWDAKIDHQLIRGGVQGIAGASSSGKTNRLAKFALRLYWAFPRSATIIVSTTTLEDLEARIWGEIKKLYNQAKERYPGLPGYITESSQRISTEPIEDEGKDFRNGIKGRACYVGSVWKGLGPYSGCKNERVALLADEGHLMPSGYFDIVGNISSNRWWLVAASGNPNDASNSFGQLCEPKQGWDALVQGDGDQVWESRTGEVLRLDGLAAPNLRAGPGKEPCAAKITHRYIEYVRRTYGEGSWQWAMWVRAKFLISVLGRRLFIRKFAERWHAFDPPNWSDGQLTDFLAADAAYGSVGGDRCVAGHWQFGKCVDGRTRLALVHGVMLIPVVAGGEALPEYQIAFWMRDTCLELGIPPERVFFDSTGRGSLVSALSKLWSPAVVGIEFGGQATDRPDPQNPSHTAREAYGNFVSELAFSLRAAIEADAIRGLTLGIVMEAEQRAWLIEGKPSRQRIESKDETRDRIKRSPDELDMAEVALEGARQLGFEFIGRSGSVTATKANRALRREADAWQSLNEEKALAYE